MSEKDELLKRERERERRREEIRLKREAEVKRNVIKAVIAGAVCLLCLVIGIGTAVSMSKKKAAREAAAEEKKREEQFIKDQEDNTIHLVAVGDNLIHSRLFESGMSETEEWNYDKLYEHVKKDVSEADIGIVTQETIFVEDRDNMSGYPTFGTPPEFGNALANTGFDVVAHASNHCLDTGTDSIEYTMNWWKENHPEVTVLGVHDSPEDAEQVKLVKCKALTLGFVDYTYGLNDIPIPEGKEYMIDVWDEKKVRKSIQKAKEQADVVIAVMHVGEEYNPDVDEMTADWTKVFLEEGVDLVIGSHPHVVRTMETLTGEDGHKMLVYYSLGNFISTQKDLPSLMGAMAKVTIRRDLKTGEIQIPEHEFLPLITHYNHDTYDYGVYKLEDYTEELANQHTAKENNPSYFNIQYYEDLFEETKAKGNDLNF